MPPTYYKCLRGDNSHLALAEPESFALRDALGRDWICYPVSEQDTGRLSLREHVADVRATDAWGQARGLSAEGTEVKICLCDDQRELVQCLADEQT